MSASLPAASASVHHVGANSSRTIRPPAARAAATRASACSGGTQTAMWIAPPPSARGSSIPSNQKAGQRLRGIDEVLVGAVGTRLVPEDGLPERHHGRGVGRAGNDEHALDRGRVGGQALVTGNRGDLPRQLQVAPAHPVVLVRRREQSHGHAVGPQVDVRRVVLDAGQLADRLHERRARRKRPRAEERARAVAHDAPVRGVVGCVEVPGRDRFAHDFSCVAGGAHARTICFTCDRSWAASPSAYQVTVRSRTAPAPLTTAERAQASGGSGSSVARRSARCAENARNEVSNSRSR